jgi:cytidyltransferase-like protein
MEAAIDGQAMTARAPIWVYADVVCDLFHAGHVEFFRQARALGDHLIVGLVSDADVATYKLPPLMTFAERQAVVRGCKWVDHVLDEAAPLHCTGAFLDRIGAAFACHGDDLAREQITFWYGDLVAAGRIRTVPYTAGISSRDIVRRLAARGADR